MQRSVGAEVEVLDRTALRRRYPSLRFDDVDAAALCPTDGRLDPNAALMGFRRAAEAAGVAYVKDRVAAMSHDGGKVTGVKLASGRELRPEIVVNCANCWADEIAAMVGMALPVRPLRRQTFHFRAATPPPEPIPAMRWQKGYALRPEGTGYLDGHDARGGDWSLPLGFRPQGLRGGALALARRTLGGLRGGQAPGRLDRPLRYVPPRRQSDHRPLDGVRRPRQFSSSSRASPVTACSMRPPSAAA